MALCRSYRHDGPTCEYVLDWFHIAMQFTVLANTMHGLEADPEFDDDPTTS